MRLIVFHENIGRWLLKRRSKTYPVARLFYSLLIALVFHSSVANGAYMTNSVTNFLSTIHHLGQPTHDGRPALNPTTSTASLPISTQPGNICSLDSQCSWNKDLICSPNGRCECQVGKWNGKQCTLETFYDDFGDIGQTGAADVADGQLESSYCLPSEVEKNGKCYIRRKPGEACEHSEQCMNIGEIEYYCIANICQEPPECPPGFVAMGAECLPFSVTGGPCIHPSQCLTGSVCIKGKCRGPCDFNQLFLEESCVDYEGAGCIAKSCISARCPRSFPSCNYIAQKKDYLCCDRSMETKVQCPLPNSEPLLDRETGTVVECMHRPCMANYRCVFASYNRGKYICCSKPKRKDGSDLTTDEEGSEENFSTQQSTTRPPFIPPPPIKPTQNGQAISNGQTPWTQPQPTDSSRWATASPWNQQNTWGGNYGNNWNNGYGSNWNGNWNNNNVQGWVPNQAVVQPQTWGNNAGGWSSYVPTNQGWTTNPVWNNQQQQQWNYNGYTNNANNVAPVTQLRRRIHPPYQGYRTRSSLNRRPGSWSTFVRTWPKKQRSRKMPQRAIISRPISRFENLQHPGYLNESVDQPVNTLVRPSPTLTKTVNGVNPMPRTGLINAPWSYAVRILIYWCCTNRVCLYKDQLNDFCNRVVNARIYAYHVQKNLQNYAENEEVEDDYEHDEQEENDSVIKPFPIIKETTKRR